MQALPDDFRDLLVELVDAGVRFLIVGGYAVAVHGYARATKDLDVWVEPSSDNAPRIYAALARFGAPIQQFQITAGDFEQYDGVLQLGVPPMRIDILTRIGGIAFQDAWDERTQLEVEGRQVPVIGIDALIANKKFVGRPQDQVDAQMLEEARSREK